MAYSDTRIVIGGLAHIPVLIFIANFFKGKLGIKVKEVNEPEVKEELVKVVEVKGTILKEEKAKSTKKISHKPEEIIKKAEDVKEQLKKKKKKKKKKERKD